MGRRNVLLGPQVYRPQSPTLAYELCQNLFFEEAPPGADAPYAMLFAPGVAEWITLGAGPTRGYHVFNNIFYAVSGNSLYRVAQDGTITALGTIPGTIEELVSMEDDGFDLVIATGASDSYKGYFYDGASVTNISDADLPQIDWLAFMDQYIIVGKVGSQVFQISALADVSAWDALDFASAESSPDNMVMGLHDHNELLLFGQNSTEIWYNSGDPDFPFARAMDGVIEVGCSAKLSVAKLDNSVFWQASDRGGISVRRLVGRVPQRISTFGIEKDLDQAAVVADARAFTYTYRGHAYYVLTLPTAGHTYVYDVASQLWHERKSKDLSYWRPLGVASCYNELLVIDSLSGKIGKLSADEHREFGQDMPWEVTCQAISVDGRRFIVNRFGLQIDPGNAVRTGQGSNPILWLAWSDDDGRTWSNEHRKEMGITGDYGRQLEWTRLGSSRKRIFRLRGSEPIATALVSAYVDMEVERV